MRVALETLLLPRPCSPPGFIAIHRSAENGSVMLQAKWDRLTGQPQFMWQTDTSWLQLEQVVQYGRWPCSGQVREECDLKCKPQLTLGMSCRSGVILGYPRKPRPFCLWAKACDLLSPQILGLTFAMTMYCQVVKADTYCA